MLKQYLQRRFDYLIWVTPDVFLPLMRRGDNLFRSLKGELKFSDAYCDV